MTALHYACRYGKTAAASFLLSMGSDLYAIDNDGFTCMHHAMKLNLYNVAVVLAKRDTVHTPTQNITSLPRRRNGRSASVKPGVYDDVYADDIEMGVLSTNESNSLRPGSSSPRARIAAPPASILSPASSPPPSSTLPSFPSHRSASPSMSILNSDAEEVQECDPTIHTSCPSTITPRLGLMRDKRGQTPLHVGAENDSRECLINMIKYYNYGQYLRLRNAEGLTPAGVAAKQQLKSLAYDLTQRAKVVALPPCLGPDVIEPHLDPSSDSVSSPSSPSSPILPPHPKDNAWRCTRFMGYITRTLCMYPNGKDASMWYIGRWLVVWLGIWLAHYLFVLRPLLKPSLPSASIFITLAIVAIYSWWLCHLSDPGFIKSLETTTLPCITKTCPSYSPSISPSSSVSIYRRIILFIFPTSSSMYTPLRNHSDVSSIRSTSTPSSISTHELRSLPAISPPGHAHTGQASNKRYSPTITGLKCAIETIRLIDQCLSEANTTHASLLHDSWINRILSCSFKKRSSPPSTTPSEYPRDDESNDTLSHSSFSTVPNTEDTETPILHLNPSLSLALPTVAQLSTVPFSHLAALRYQCLLTLGITSPYLVCVPCGVAKPWRSKHCNRCDACVYRLDHRTSHPFFPIPLCCFLSVILTYHYSKLADTDRVLCRLILKSTLSQLSTQHIFLNLVCPITHSFSPIFSLFFPILPPLCRLSVARFMHRSTKLPVIFLFYFPWYYPIYLVYYALSGCCYCDKGNRYPLLSIWLSLCLYVSFCIYTLWKSLLLSLCQHVNPRAHCFRFLYASQPWWRGKCLPLCF